MRSCFIPPGSLTAQIQPFLSVDAVYTLPVVFPTFPPQQRIYSIVTVPNPDGGNFFYSLPDSPIVPPPASVVPGGSKQPDYLARPLNRYLVALLKVFGQLLLLGHP
jgi:hypothetical protein